MANYDGMNADFRAKLMGLVNASGGKIKINSGYRSVEKQQGLWDKKVNEYKQKGYSQAAAEKATRTWVAFPGSSNHNKGLAADLAGDLKLAHKLAPQFGLHFPMGHEPWHIEPMGLKANPKAYTVPPTATVADDADDDAVDAAAATGLTPNPINELAMLFGGNAIDTGLGGGDLDLQVMENDLVKES